MNKMKRFKYKILLSVILGILLIAFNFFNFYQTAEIYSQSRSLENDRDGYYSFSGGKILKVGKSFVGYHYAMDYVCFSGSIKGNLLTNNLLLDRDGPKTRSLEYNNQNDLSYTSVNDSLTGKYNDLEDKFLNFCIVQSILRGLWRNK